MKDHPSVGSQFYMMAAKGFVDEHVLKCVSMMLNASEKMARHLVEQTDEQYDEDEGKSHPVSLAEAQSRAMSFALMHGQLDMAWEQCGFKKREGIPDEDR